MRTLLPKSTFLSPEHLLVFDAPMQLCHQAEQGLGSMKTTSDSSSGCKVCLLHHCLLYHSPCTLRFPQHSRVAAAKVALPAHWETLSRGWDTARRAKGVTFPRFLAHGVSVVLEHQRMGNPHPHARNKVEWQWRDIPFPALTYPMTPKHFSHLQ